MNTPRPVWGSTVPLRRSTTPGMPEAPSIDSSWAMATTASSGSPTIMASTSGARSIDSAGAAEACGPKQTSGAPKRRFSFTISLTSKESVGVVLQKTISPGLNDSASSRSMTDSVDRRSAVRSMTLKSMPSWRNSDAMTISEYGGLVVPSTSSRSWHRPCRVKATPLTSGGLMSSVVRPIIDCMSCSGQ